MTLAHAERITEEIVRAYRACPPRSPSTFPMLCGLIFALSGLSFGESLNICARNFPLEYGAFETEAGKGGLFAPPLHALHAGRFAIVFDPERN